MFIEQSHDEVYGCLKGGSENSGGKRLAISMVDEAWLSEKKELSNLLGGALDLYLTFTRQKSGSFGRKQDDD
ncbi:hypothetical protein Tco_0065932 [Tanacetum coccineum]